MSSRATFVRHYKGARKQDWQTHPDLFAALHRRFNFTLDGAATKANALLPTYSTRSRPVDWTGHRVFCNPPWDNILPFVRRAPGAVCAVLLVPARVNSRWFHAALALGAKVEFLPKRPRFVKGRRTGKSSSPFDCVLLTWGV